MAFQRLQYYCSKCENVLRETESEIILGGISEPCPFCGSLLSESLGKRRLGQKAGNVPVFQAASKVPRLTIDIRKVDSMLPFLSLGQRILLSGRQSQKIIERLAVRAQLPHRHGGLDSDVVIVDGGNSSDPYLCINFARQYGLDVSITLSRIISARAFTIYQLENLISRELLPVVKKRGAKIVMISDMLAMFSDPHLDMKDAARQIGSILESISKLRECLVIASVSGPTRYDDVISRSFDRVIHLHDGEDGVSVGLEESRCAIREDDLEVISRR